MLECRNRKIIEENVLRSISRNFDELPEIGENISFLPEIKIAFDGYSEDDDEIEDLNEQSFAVYIYKCSGDENFISQSTKRPHGQSYIGQPKKFVTLYE